MQGGFYCKGIDPSGFTGEFSAGTASAVTKFLGFAGLTNQEGIATAMVMDALLNTDAYVLVDSGDSDIRIIQQSLNQKYYEYIGLIPCNGIVDKNTTRALIMGLQVEEKKTNSAIVVDGIWGENTLNNCPILQRYATITNEQFVYLLQYALCINGYDPNGFDGAFGGGGESAVKGFQEFVALDVDGAAGSQTWASLLVSYGDKNRTCTGCDCSTTITQELAETLTTAGYSFIGRYLTGRYLLSTDELTILYENGLTLFPIFQRSGEGLSEITAIYFTYAQGKGDAIAAISAAEKLKISEGTTIYFAVDYDATDDEITGYVLSYFEGINAQLELLYNTAVSFKEDNPRTVLSANELVTQYLRKDDYNGIFWSTLAGVINSLFTTYVDENVTLGELELLVDPSTDLNIGISHYMATLNTMIHNSFNVLRDLSGWAGDLLTLSINVMEEYNNEGGDIYDITYNVMGTRSSYFSMDDLIADIDAYNLSVELNNSTTPIYNVFNEYYSSSYASRYSKFLENAFQSSYTSLCEIATDYLNNTVSVFGGWIPIEVFQSHFQLPDFSENQGNAIAQAFCDFLKDKINNE